jgi:hypothetical protein
MTRGKGMSNPAKARPWHNNNQNNNNSRNNNDSRVKITVAITINRVNNNGRFHCCAAVIPWSCRLPAS